MIYDIKIIIPVVPYLNKLEKSEKSEVIGKLPIMINLGLNHLADPGLPPMSFFPSDPLGFDPIRDQGGEL